MKNERVRKKLFLCEVKQYELAVALKVHEQTLSRWLRVELPESEQTRLCEVIERISEERKNERNFIA